ncbi:hypothetical protein W822_19980 [Advenella kashmirensis W13003]|uniref:Uncharacterized protein n=1 Tax=Advenella kashmirensis W13003 TaxID=1424334 RepID=V8QNL8_9BURK|nr:hypothetical protein [Advenella kashmirensis]ETF00933.1 hypothetical protein W822_19980 [Advenella kashmirensis W13003]
MALDIDDRMKRYWASNPPDEYPIYTLAIAHSDLSKVFRFWNQPGVGWLDVEGTLMEHRSVNFQIEQNGTNSNLDQLFRIAVDVVDSQDELREELDSIPLTTKERIVIVYRSFLYPVLDAPTGLARLQAESLTYVKGAANVNAVSPRYNLLRTGEVYSPREIPMLRGFQ